MKNIKRLSASALAITTASTLILGLAACGSDDNNSAPGTDENGVDSNGVVKVDDTDSGIDAGPVIKPLKPGEKVTYSQPDNRKSDPNDTVLLSLKLDNVVRKEDRTCFDLIGVAESLEGPTYANKDFEEGDTPEDDTKYKSFPSQFQNLVLNVTANISAGGTSTEDKKATSGNTMGSLHINTINGGRISERLPELITLRTTPEKDESIPYGLKAISTRCAYNPDNKPLNVNDEDIFGFADIDDITGEELSFDQPEPPYKDNDKPGSTGWVIDPQ